MNFTSKSRYALKIMMDLACFQDRPLVSRRDIAMRQGVPFDYLDQIMIRLRRGRLIDSIRGRGGGYRLARSPEKIAVWEIFSAVEDNIYPVGCLEVKESCNYEGLCISEPAWEMIANRVADVLSAITLQTLLSQGVDGYKMCPLGGVKECRTGKSGSRAVSTSIGE